MSFKTMLEEDLAVFFDAEELAETITVDGVELAGFLKDDIFENKKESDYGQRTEKKILILKESDLISVPSIKYRAQLIINDELYTVYKPIDYKKGVVEIKIEGNRS